MPCKLKNKKIEKFKCRDPFGKNRRLVNFQFF